MYLNCIFCDNDESSIRSTIFNYQSLQNIFSLNGIKPESIGEELNKSLRFFQCFRSELFWGQIQIQVQAFLWIWIQIQVIPMDRAWNSADLFTFLKFENLSTGSKVISHQSWALFVQKNWLMMNSAKKYIFGQKLSNFDDW